MAVCSSGVVEIEVMLGSAMPRATVRALATPGHTAAPAPRTQTTTNKKIVVADEERKRVCGQSRARIMA